MDKQVVARLCASFEEIARTEPEIGTEFWCARDLQILLGYTEWRNFAKVVDKAITACEKAGYKPRDHFVGINKMVVLGSGAKREIVDIALTRYACYLIAQNGDPSKQEIAFAQTYFAVQTRKQGYFTDCRGATVRLKVVLGGATWQGGGQQDGRTSSGAGAGRRTWLPGRRRTSARTPPGACGLPRQWGLSQVLPQQFVGGPLQLDGSAGSAAGAWTGRVASSLRKAAPTAWSSLSMTSTFA